MVNDVNEENVSIPFSSYKLQINDYSIIDTETGRIILPEIKNEKKFVYLNWFNGLNYYEHGLVIVIAIMKPKIPIQFFNDIEVLFDDSNQTNTLIENLSYRFKRNLEIESNPGFFYIPYYTTYGINKDGVTVSLKSGKIKSWNKTNPVKKKNITGGYYSGRFKNDYLSLSHSTRHRLLALCFINYRKNPFKLVINHKNGIPGYDSLSNLEWVTRAENNKHAYETGLFKNKTVKVLLKRLDSGLIESYKTVTECGIKNDLNLNFIYNRLNKTHVRYSDNLCFKVDDGTDWPDFTVFRQAIKFREVIFINIFNGKITITNGLNQAEEISGVNRATIAFHCNNVLCNPYNGFLFRYLDEDIVWPTFSEKHLSVFKMYPTGLREMAVIVKDKNGNEVDFCESLTLASEKYSINKQTLYSLCKKQKSKNGLSFNFFDSRKN